MTSLFGYLFDNEWRQRHDIETLRMARRLDTVQARRKSRKQASRIDDLEAEVAEMRLFTRALLQLLQENGTIEGERLREVLLAIDASDGTVDGRFEGEEAAARAREEAEPAAEPGPEDRPPAPVRRKKHH